jgi:L-amino acid N-acyltransferase YncA
MRALIREYQVKDVEDMTEIWNEVVSEGVAFPQTEPMSAVEARDFFPPPELLRRGGSGRADCGVIYILHPNNVGRCAHIANASYAVSSSARGMKIGEELVRHSLCQAKALGYGVLQFNAVVKSNLGAIRLYETLGFVRLGTIPKGFRLKDGSFEDILIFYYAL